MIDCIITGCDGSYSLDGVLSFATASGLLAESADWMQPNSGQAITVDLKNISKADSAGLALMTEWVRLAKKNGHQLQFTNIPDQLKNLIRISGLEALFD